MNSVNFYTKCSFFHFTVKNKYWILTGKTKNKIILTLASKKWIISKNKKIRLIKFFLNCYRLNPFQINPPKVWMSDVTTAAYVACGMRYLVTTFWTLSGSGSELNWSVWFTGLKMDSKQVWWDVEEKQTGLKQLPDSNW